MKKNKYKYYSKEMLQTMKNPGQNSRSDSKYKYYSKEMLQTMKNPGQSCSRSDSDGRNEPDDYYYDLARKHIIETGTAPPRPPHFKGREIGMWHKQMAKLKKALQKEGHDVKLGRSKPIKSLGDVELSRSQQREIKEVLDNLPNKMNQLSSNCNNSYDNIEDSDFKKKFLQNIYGTLEDHINNSNKNFEQDILLDEILYKELESKHSDEKFTAMLEKRKLLPSYKVKDEVITLINSNQVTLISGETGCGKTTQVPQFLLDHFIENMRGSTCKIVCTQPRRISAISIAERVAEERAEKLGNSSGYMIRLERKIPRDRGSVTFCTTGVVLRQMERDPCLSEFTHIIIDEIHERDIQSDFLITLLKQVIAKRRDLKVILMSATLNAESFSKYYNECPHLNIPGFTHPVEEYFLEEVLHKTEFRFQNVEASKGKKCKPLTKTEAEFFRIIQPHIKELRGHDLYPPSVYCELSKPQSEQLNLQLIFQLLHHICSEETDMGAVLIFLPGFTDITELIRMIEQSGWYPPHRFLIIPLHSRVPTIGQRKVFNPPPPGVRKIVVATNIAETSITIDDVVFVIDCGKIKINYYDTETNTQTLEARWVSKANAAQRKGRAGRVKPGVCYHLISRVRYEALDDYILPEILRVRLENVILTAKILQLGNIEDFFSRLMDSPDPNIVATSLHLLKRLEALDRNEFLTPLGYHLAKLPMHPQIGKMILFGALFNCLDPILNIAVTLEFKDPFYIPMGNSKLADRRKKEFADNCGSDHILMANVLREYECTDGIERNRLCSYYFLSKSVLNQLVQLKKNFMENLYSLGFVASQDSQSECNCNSNNMDLIRAVICAGLYPNIAKLRSVGKKRLRNVIYLPNATRGCFHPKSILIDEYIPNPMLAYYKLIKSSSMFIHDATPVDPFHVIFFGDDFEEIIEYGTNYITINKTLKFRCMQSTSNMIRALRDKLNNFLEYQISHPSVVDLRQNSEESLLFRTIIELLTDEQTAECDFNFPDMGEYY